MSIQVSIIDSLASTNVYLKWNTLKEGNNHSMIYYHSSNIVEVISIYLSILIAWELS